MAECSPEHCSEKEPDTALYFHYQACDIKQVGVQKKTSGQSFLWLLKQVLHFSLRLSQAFNGGYYVPVRIQGTDVMVQI